MKIGKTFLTKISKAKLLAVGLLLATVMSFGATASTSAQGWWGNDWNNNWGSNWGWRVNRWCGCQRWNPCHWNNWNNWGSSWNNNWNNSNWGWGGGGNSSIIIND
jgi:hypothetical protein